jgi:hypothetical protein
MPRIPGQHHGYYPIIFIAVNHEGWAASPSQHQKLINMSEYQQAKSSKLLSLFMVLGALTQINKLCYIISIEIVVYMKSFFIFAPVIKSQTIKSLKATTMQPDLLPKYGLANYPSTAIAFTCCCISCCSC